ncbi:MAG: translation elongation factor Ts [Candidatus Vogelbacteria bacterium]|nr:translation elongation factor Ts [Candidatus Vogelbacteria bacterium]
MITVEQIKALREKTGISIAQCKKALATAGGDFDQALAALYEQGAAVAAGKADRAVGAGAISSYVHNNAAVGALVEINCETDFVARAEGFRALADDLAMHIAAFEPPTVEQLLTQPFVKDSSLTVADIIKQNIQKFGENISIARFARLAVGER